MNRRKAYHRTDDRQTGRAAETGAMSTDSFPWACDDSGRSHAQPNDRLGMAPGMAPGGLERIEHLRSRRSFLRGSVAAGAGMLAALGALAGGLRKALGDEAVETGKFIFPRLQFSVLDGTPDIWNVGPSGDVILRKKLRELSNINVSMDPKVVRLGDFDELCRYPFVFMTSEGFFKLPDKEEKNLREYLERGGLILADDCVFAGKDDRFFRCYRDLINRLFPENKMRHIPPEHEIYHIHFDFGKKGSPHMQGVQVHDGFSGAWGLFEKGTGRIMTYLDPGDLHCGWMCKYWGLEKSMEAIKMGINVILYFLSH